MRILVYGAGVIGTTIAWQLSEAGFDVSLLVRKQRMVRYSNSGISIACTDLRPAKKTYSTTVFRPGITDQLDPGQAYDLIIVTLKQSQLHDAVPYLAKYSGNAHILFMGSLWNEFDLIRKHFAKERFLFGYPGTIAGGRNDSSIYTYLFKTGNTLLGEPDGRITERIKKIAEIFGESGMRPSINQNIAHWIQAQYIWQGALWGASRKAGSYRAYARNKKMIRHSVSAIREGFRLLKKRGGKPYAIFPFVLFALPAWMVSGILKRSVGADLQEAMEAQAKHGTDSLNKQYETILSEGRKQGIDMYYWKSFEKYVAQTG